MAFKCWETRIICLHAPIKSRFKSFRAFGPYAKFILSETQLLFGHKFALKGFPIACFGCDGAIVVGIGREQFFGFTIWRAAASVTYFSEILFRFTSSFYLVFWRIFKVASTLFIVLCLFINFIMNNRAKAFECAVCAVTGIKVTSWLFVVVLLSCRFSVGGFSRGFSGFSPHFWQTLFLKTAAKSN